MSQIKEKDFYEDAGARYDSLMSSGDFGYFIDRRKEMLKSFCRADKNSLILDLGCGTGVYKDAFSEDQNLIGVDYSFSALKVYNNKYGKARLINADACCMPLKGGSVDVVILFGLLHHLYNKIDMLLSEIRRVLKVGGLVLIDEPNGYNPLWYIVLLSELGKGIDGGFSKTISPSSLKKDFEKRDFKISFERHWAFFPLLFMKAKLFRRLDSLLEGSILRMFSIRFHLIAEKTS